LNEPFVNIHEELVSRCRAGDQVAHYKLYQLYSKAMYNVALRVVNNEDEAEDVIQEAFISAFKNLHHYRGDASFGAWLKRIVVNKGINALKKRKLEPLPENESFDLVESEESEVYLPDLTVDRVRKAIRQLPDGYRTVLSLYLLEGYDHQEIAEITGISESTSKSQLNRAKSKLRELLLNKN
jgi:RNA polymerase sigma factor (sigma-70 family)